jgi:hypothetical protein
MFLPFQRPPTWGWSRNYGTGQPNAPMKCTSQETPPPEGREAESDGKKIIAFDERVDSGLYRVNRDNSADSLQYGAPGLDNLEILFKP